MEFTELNYKLVQDGDYFDVVINVDTAFSEEFGMDFGGDYIKEKYENLQKHLREKHPDANLRLGKIMLGGLLVGSFALAPVIIDDSQSLAGSASGAITETNQSAEITPGVEPRDINTQVQNVDVVRTDTNENIHTVKAGDTLWLLSKAYSVSVDDLRDANNLTNDSLELDQRLVIPNISNSAQANTGTTANNPGEYFNYTVSKGDTLWIIANKLEVTVDEIKNLNNLGSDNLNIGQQLTIPGVAPTAINNNIGANPNTNVNVNVNTVSPTENTYTAQKGDTLWIIANRFKLGVSDLKSANTLVSDSLSIGQKLVIPAGDTGSTVIVTPTTHKVIKGDTLWIISNKYHINVNALKTANNLSTDNLIIGQTLVIPDTVAQTQTPTPAPIPTPAPAPAPAPAATTSGVQAYTVQKGDTLWSIANKYNTTPTAIKADNNLKSDNLSLGQTLNVTAIAIDTSSMDQNLASKIKYFPLASGSSYFYTNDYNANREWTPTGTTARTHQGNDIMASKGTPIVAVADGKVVRYGWNNTGGYRMMIQVDGTNKAIYYAHMSKYAPDIKLGSTVKAGQVIGYVGDTGYGPLGTSGKFDPHLHIGVYNTSNFTDTENPYYYLRGAENGRA